MMQFFDLKDQDMRERFEDALSSQDIGSLVEKADLAMEAQHRRALGELQAHRQLDVEHTSLTLLHGRVMKTRSMSPSTPYTGRSPIQPAEVGRAAPGCSFLSEERSSMHSSQRQLPSNSGSMTSATVVVVGESIIAPSPIIPASRVAIPPPEGDEGEGDEATGPLSQQQTTTYSIRSSDKSGGGGGPSYESSTGTHLPEGTGISIHPSHESNNNGDHSDENVNGNHNHSMSLLSGSHSTSTVHYQHDGDGDSSGGPSPPTSTMMNNPRGLGFTTFHNVVSASSERSPNAHALAMDSVTAPHFGSHASVQAQSSSMETGLQQSSAQQDSASSTHQPHRELGSSTEEFRGVPLTSPDMPEQPPPFSPTDV
eukprot:TRINITY_DN18184_c0_g6_i1.p1 TRINITY_DN18184_c0_g6~~TRINITY_DN18184_c0_g6_i1.p1  ORF type:complete len:368 (+),score=32.12 TRINITY_DN18184_c0_g6_i1:408-1511(+)